MKNLKLCIITAIAALSMLHPGCSDMMADLENTGVENTGTENTTGSVYPPNAVFISDAAGLDTIRNNLTGYYVLTANIDLSGIANWTPIGDNLNRFTGTLDGNGCTISNLTIINNTVHDQGLFGAIESSGTVKNLFVSGTVEGYIHVGFIAGINYGIITGCCATGNVSGYSYIGGLVGYNMSTITRCCATGDASGTGIIGGLVGKNNGTITSCYATGSVSGSNHIGGLVGYNMSTITSCYATGNVNGTDYIGGLVGDNMSTVTASYYDQTTSGQNDTGRGEPRTTAQMKLTDTSVTTYDGWDFTTVWGISSSINSGYPYLRENMP